MDKNQDGVISIDEFMEACRAVSWRFRMLKRCRDFRL